MAPPPQPGQEDGARPVRVSLVLQVLAWLIALPIGLAVVVWPARRFNFLSGQRLLDVVVGTGWGRYWRVLAIAPLWALATTVLVQLMIFGMRKLGERRRSIRAERAGGAEPVAASSRPGGSRGRRR